MSFEQLAGDVDESRRAPFIAPRRSRSSITNVCRIGGSRFDSTEMT
ncbi:hypothetical protein MAR_001190 [Mya arenaria]|uniref:Uncharacterized protein n=1 Tax=Mya arenaria TaxID=6604 RepID=A0ABY7FCM0_MYAAR|nr:hypothetical protein MAR_001190 [Mya arenaria]